MLASLTRLQALLLIAVLIALAALSLTIRPEPDGAAITGAGTYSDVRLYTEIAEAVAGGEGYYQAATRLHRAHDFPTRPFVTVRLPTLAWIEATLGWRGASVLLSALLAAAALAWFAMLRPLVSLPESLAATVLVLFGGAMVASPGLVVTHELWAGVLVALATALLVRGAWVPALFAAACALAIRELALPFVLVAALWAAHGRQWRRLGGWTALLAVYALVLWLHRAAIAPLSLPTDPRSQGWDGLRGPGAPLRDIAEVTLINLMAAPASFLVAFLCLTGFLGAPRALARVAIPWLIAIVLLLAVFARPVNFYWAILTVPMVTAGLAFLPRMARDLGHALGKAPSPL